MGSEGKRAPLFRPWMKIVLAASALAAVAIGVWYFVNADALGRPAPPVNPRYELNGLRLRKAPIVSPTEEHFAPDGSIVYLTTEQFRAANSAAALSLPGFDRRLAEALAEPDPDRQAELLAATFDAVPKTSEGDETALALYRLASGALAAPPQTAARLQTKKRLDATIGCRFTPLGSKTRLPPCAQRPSLITPYVLASAGGLGLVVVVVAALVRARRRSRMVPVRGRAIRSA